MLWDVKTDNNEYISITDKDVRTLISDGIALPHHHIRKHGGKEWVSLGNVKGVRFPKTSQIEKPIVSETITNANVIN